MNKTTRYSSITLILISFVILGSNYVFGGCCYPVGGEACDSDSTEDSCLNPSDGSPDNIFNESCDNIPECEYVCCCKTSYPYTPHYTIRGQCEDWESRGEVNPWVYRTENECNTEYCKDVVVCKPDGCNGVCPSGCTVAEDADCGCSNNNGCCGIGCDNANDNDCPSVLLGSVSGYVYNITRSNRIANAYVWAEDVNEENVEVRSTTTDTNGQYLLTDLPYDTYRIYAEKEGFKRGRYPDNINLGGDLTGRNINLTPIEEGTCYSENPPTPEIIADHVKGRAAVNLIWSIECGNVDEFTITRNPEHPSGEIKTDEFFYLDEDVSFGQTYTYSIKAHYYIIGRESEWSNVEITLGSELCEGIFGDEEFCLNESYQVGEVNVYRYYCDDSNNPILILDCSQTDPPSICIGPDENGNTECVYKSNCKEIGPPPNNNPYPFGLYYTGASCLNDGWCYYDHSSTTIDMCNNCEGITCYDYKSKDACETDNCGARGLYIDKAEGTNHGCEWIDLWKEFGKGICYDPDYIGVDKCSLCGSEGDVFYNTNCNQAICSALGSCYLNSSGSCSECIYEGDKTDCRDFTTEEACIGGQEIDFENNGCGDDPIRIIPSNDACNLGVCKWSGSRCYKDANDDGIDDCDGNPTPQTCNRDTEAPITIPESNIPDMNVFGYGINFTSDADAVKFYFCVGDENCCPFREEDFEGNTVKVNPSLYLAGDIEAGIYYIRYYSIDKYYNVEQVKTLPFYIDKTPPIVTLSYSTQKVGGNLFSVLAIRLESDEFITCSYSSIIPNPGDPTKDDFGQGDIRRVFELEFHNILDTNYDLETICKDDVGNENIHTWNLFSPFNITIYKDGASVDEIGVGIYTIQIRTKEIFNSLNVNYSFIRSSNILVEEDIVMSKIGNLLWEGTFTIPTNHVDDTFKMNILGYDVAGNTHTITNTDYRINTIGPSIQFDPVLKYRDTVYTENFKITGYTDPDSTVRVRVYACTSDKSPAYCTLSSKGPFSDVSESHLAPVKIINKPVEMCDGKYPEAGDNFTCFKGNLQSEYGFDAGLQNAPTYYLEFVSPVHRTRRYEVEKAKVLGLDPFTTTYIYLKQPLEEDLGGTYNASAYLTQYPPGWFDVTAELNTEWNMLEIYAEKENKLGFPEYLWINYNTTGLNIVQITPPFDGWLYSPNLQSIKVEVTTNFAADCNIINPQENRVAKEFNYQLTPSNNKKTHSIVFNSSYCGSPIGSGPFCYLNNDASTSGGIRHKYNVSCIPDIVGMMPDSETICFGVATWYEMSGIEYELNICNGASGCSGSFIHSCLPCTPSCVGKECGSDGCGGSCGSCTPGETKCINYQCVTCSPNCVGKECGSDGCGGSCGSCTEGKVCVEGECRSPVGGKPK